MKEKEMYCVEYDCPVCPHRVFKKSDVLAWVEKVGKELEEEFCEGLFQIGGMVKECKTKYPESSYLCQSCLKINEFLSVDAKRVSCSSSDEGKYAQPCSGSEVPVASSTDKKEEKKEEE